MNKRMVISVQKYKLMADCVIWHLYTILIRINMLNVRIIFLQMIKLSAYVIMKKIGIGHFQSF